MVRLASVVAASVGFLGAFAVAAPHIKPRGNTHSFTERAPSVAPSLFTVSGGYANEDARAASGGGWEYVSFSRTTELLRKPGAVIYSNAELAAFSRQIFEEYKEFVSILKAKTYVSGTSEIEVDPGQILLYTYVQDLYQGDLNVTSLPISKPREDEDIIMGKFFERGVSFFFFRFE
jgi:hypothetical protein